MTTPAPPSPPVPFAPTSGLATAPLAEARSLLLAARHDLDDAAVGARRSLAVPWESGAADRFRQDVEALLAGLDHDRQVLDEVEAVLAR
ncbi:hypothetical protein [Isoptericola sp. NPDC055881]